MTTETCVIAPERIAIYRATGRHQSHAAVRRAILNGDLPHPSNLACVDCGAEATDYEHRDYSKPLDVEPVCHPCNMKRGRGADHPQTQDRLNAYSIEHETRWREFAPPPALAPMDKVAACKSYSAAVRLAWDLRFYRAMTSSTLCERIGVLQNHISEMLAGDGKPGRRELPAKRINDFEWAVGNRAITQYLLLKSEIAKDLPLLQALIQCLETT